jgi:hypothetical protein
MESRSPGAAAKLAHGDCPVLTWMASNVVAKLEVKDNIYPNKERPENKIDGMVSLITRLRRGHQARKYDYPRFDDFLARPDRGCQLDNLAKRPGSSFVLAAGGHCWALAWRWLA